MTTPPHPSDLSDIDLLKAVAEEVLDWGGVYRNSEGNLQVSSGGYKFLRLDWFSIGQVICAIRNLENVDIRGQLHINDHHYEMRFWITNHRASERPTWFAEDENPARAVFEAAIKTIRNVKG